MWTNGIILIAFLLVGMGYLYWLKNRFSLDSFPFYVLSVLFIYHLIFIFVFHNYLTMHGGDSIRYWEITADNSQYIEGWMDYFGISTFFLQWLNYPLSNILNLNYFTGNLIYGWISFQGFAVLFIFLWKKAVSAKFPKAVFLLMIVPLFFPNIHFWTAGVGKEALLFPALVLALVSLEGLKKHYTFFIIGFLGCFLVKPFVAVLLLVSLCFLIFKSRKINRLYKIGVIGLVLAVAIAGAVTLAKRAQIQKISLSALEQFSDSQFRYLKKFNASTELDMQALSFPGKLASVIFRPLIFESEEIYFGIAALENWISLFLLCFFMIKINRISTLPFPLLLGVILTVPVFIVFAFTLNNLGLFLRMKSVWMPFLQLSAVWLICCSILGVKSNHQTVEQGGA